MFLNFFFDLKQAQLPVSLKEYLMLMEAMNKRVITSFNVNDFYYLSRSALVKDERYLDKFDRVFGHSFKGLENSEGETEKEIPEDVKEEKYNFDLSFEIVNIELDNLSELEKVDMKKNVIMTLREKLNILDRIFIIDYTKNVHFFMNKSDSLANIFSSGVVLLIENNLAVCTFHLAENTSLIAFFWSLVINAV